MSDEHFGVCSLKQILEHDGIWVEVGKEDGGKFVIVNAFSTNPVLLLILSNEIHNIRLGAWENTSFIRYNDKLGMRIQN